MALAGQPPTALAPTSVGREPVRRGAKWGALTAVSLATFAVLIDFMAVSLALPHIRASFDATFSELQSVVEAFVVCLAACILGAGYVADRFGRLRAFTAGLTLFGLGALVSGVAPSIYALIAGRVVEGVGGALLLATGALLVAEIYGHKRERAALAIWGTVTGAAVVISPVVGSAITSYLGWRWIFVLEAALAGIAVVTTMVTVQEPSLDRTRTPSADWRGLALFATAVAVLVTGLVRTTTALGGWAQSGVLACFACSGLLLIAFIAVEAVSPAPVLDLSLFRLRTFTGSAVAAFGLSMAVLGPLIFLVLYLSYGLGFSTMSIGAHLLLLSGMTLPLLPLAWWLDKYIPVKVLLSGGLTCVAVGLWLLSRLPSLPTLSDLTPGLVMMGVGLELLNPRLASTAAAPVGTQLAAPASRANSTFRWVGTAIGVAVVGSVFATRLSDDITSRIAGSSQLSGQGPQLAGLALEGRTRLMVGSAPSDYRSVMLGIVRESFSDAMHEAFVVAAGVALASAVVALCIRSRDLPGHGARTSAATVPALVVAIPRAVPAPAPLAPLPPAPAELVGGLIGDVSQVSVPAFKAVPAVPVAQAVPAVPPSADNAAGNPTAASEEPEMPPITVTPVTPVALETPATPAPAPAPASATLTTSTTPGSLPNGTPVIVLDEKAGASASQGPGLEPWRDRRLVAVGTLSTDRAKAGLEVMGAGSLAGQVLKSNDGLPLKAELALVSPEARVVVRHWTGPDGQFILLDLAAGDYELVVQSMGYRSEAVPVVIRTGETSTASVALVGLGHVYGAVAARDGGWLPGVLLTLTDEAGAPLAHTTTDDAGSYYFPRVTQGRYKVAAPGCDATASVVDVSPGLAVAADLVLGPAPGQNGEVVVPSAGGT